ncbi:uncharacterized protein LOC142571503 isoform X1 [Dermacentor variabilis]|uniref:uncharacterized protein LOC142571503 isoform X1 n=1 Tax=Dermacentor variabilis TaxID=34621 RepID=UPI003F5C626F
MAAAAVALCSFWLCVTAFGFFKTAVPLLALTSSIPLVETLLFSAFTWSPVHAYCLATVRLHGLGSFRVFDIRRCSRNRRLCVRVHRLQTLDGSIVSTRLHALNDATAKMQNAPLFVPELLCMQLQFVIIYFLNYPMVIVMRVFFTQDFSHQAEEVHCRSALTLAGHANLYHNFMCKSQLAFSLISDEESGMLEVVALDAAYDSVMSSQGKSVYTCKLCNKAFQNYSNLKRHVKLHDPVQEYFPCTLCQRKYGRKDTLKGHMKQAHGVLTRW